MPPSPISSQQLYRPAMRVPTSPRRRRRRGRGRSDPAVGSGGGRGPAAGRSRKLPAAVVGGEQRLDPPAEGGVGRARLVQVGRPGGRVVDLEGGQEDGALDDRTVWSGRLAVGRSESTDSRRADRQRGDGLGPGRQCRPAVARVNREREAGTPLASRPDPARPSVGFLRNMRPPDRAAARRRPRPGWLLPRFHRPRSGPRTGR